MPGSVLGQSHYHELRMIIYTFLKFVGNFLALLMLRPEIVGELKSWKPQTVTKKKKLKCLLGLEELFHRDSLTGYSATTTVAVASSLNHVQLLQPQGLEPARLLCPWDSLGKNAEEGCHFLLQDIFPIQGSNLCLFRLLHCRRILYHWATKGSPMRT